MSSTATSPGNWTSSAASAGPRKQPRLNSFASEENQKFVIQTLVTDLARAYFQLLALDQQLDISERTVKVRDESLKLVQAAL